MLFDGDPNHDGPGTLWRLAADEGVTCFGVGSPFITACRRAGIAPGEQFDLSALRAVGATGAPLPPDGFRWVYESVSPDVMLSPISGGTDVCSAFVGGNPLTPVWEGEIPPVPGLRGCRLRRGRLIGCGGAGRARRHAADAVDAGRLLGRRRRIALPRRLLRALPGRVAPRRLGHAHRARQLRDHRSLRRHAQSRRARVGTAEIYRVAEAVEGVVDSLVVHLEAADAADPGTLLLFVVLAGDEQLDETATRRIRDAIRRDLSPRHVPDEVCR